MTARRCDAQKFHSAVFDAMLRCYMLPPCQRAAIYAPN